MTTQNKLQIEKDLPNKKITVTRLFDATPDLVWRAWTESELLDQWWAPKPWRAETKSMDFKEGGVWLYSMVGPANERNWCRVDFTRIEPEQRFDTLDSFCDENGNKNEDFPVMEWKNSFHPTETGTKVLVEIKFRSEAGLEQIIGLGFEEGFTSALGNLDHYLSTQFRMRKELKQDNKARVTTYLNFPGNTEEAFNFYKKVLKGTLTGNGFTRFGDKEIPAGTPPLSEADKKLILHAELIILGGHVLMATDAPESMGLKLEQGTNMHINLEPESRAETERIFHELSEGGNITMPLADMFWGAYFGTFTDRYGINWMLNFQEVV